MNKYLVVAVVLMTCGSSVFAANATSSIDGGGQKTTSANYSMDSSLGGIGGTTDGGAVTLKSGYIGQLTEVTNLIVTADGNPVNEGDTSQLGGVARMDDGTVTALSGAEIVWLTPVHPVGSISAGGLATTLPVYADMTASVTGAFMGVTARGEFLVRDNSPDNFGCYAGDQVADGWQVRYFGMNNPQGMGGATNCTGQNNLYTYTADLNPTNPSSVFEVVGLSNQPPNRVVCFHPTSTGRVYRLLYSTNLASGVWTNLPGCLAIQGQAGQMALSDSNSASARFYRVEVRVP